MTEYSHEQNLRLAQQMLDQRSQINTLTDERDGAYRERAHLLAWLATLHPSVIAPSLDIDDEDDWQLLFINVHGHQLSWHISPRDTALFEHVEHVDVADPRAQWDGHTTDEKYEHIRQLAALAGPEPHVHVYLSTGCFHGDHDYCKSMTGLNGAKRPASCKKCGAKCICPCHQGEEPADTYEQAVARVESSGPRPEATEATDPDTITDPQWLRQQYAAAMYRLKCPYGNPWEDTLLIDRPPFLQLADAVLTVHDRHLLQLRQRLELADEVHRDTQQRADQLAATLREVLTREATEQPVNPEDYARWAAALNAPKEPTP